MKSFLFFIALIICSVSFSAFARADVYSNGAGDPTVDLIKRTLVQVGRPLSEIKSSSYAIKKAEFDYKINPILLIAVMEEELKFSGFAQAHVCQNNVDNGIAIPNEKVTSLPSPYNDIDCVARALANQIDTFHGDLETAIAAYFFGTVTMKSHNLTELDTSGKKILQNVFNFIQNNPDERKNGTPIKMDSTPKVVKNFKKLPSRAYRSNPVVVESGKPSSIEEKYVKVMRYFNKKLDQKSADEIYWSIASLHSQFPNVDARLVMALVAVESAFRPNAVSCKGAQGLGQLMPFTSDSLNVTDPFDCSENIKGTFLYLDREFKRMGDKRYPLDLVLAAYNAGAGAVQRAGYDIPNIPETKNYVRKVVNIYMQLLLPEEHEEKLSGQTRYYSR
jgi:hypothetical protein